MDWKGINSDPSGADAAATTTGNGGKKKRKLPAAAASMEATNGNNDFSANNESSNPQQKLKKKKYVRGKTCPLGWQQYGNTINTTAVARAPTQVERKTKKNKNNKHANDNTSHARNRDNNGLNYPEINAYGETDIDELAAVLTGATNPKISKKESVTTGSEENDLDDLDASNDIWSDHPNTVEYMNSEEMKNLRIKLFPQNKPYTIVGAGFKTPILGKSWTVLKKHNKINGDDSDQSLHYVDCETTVVNWVNRKIRRRMVVRVSGAIHYPNRYESILPIHLVTEQGHKVDSESLFHGGTQRIQLMGGNSIDLFRNGEQIFFYTFDPCKKDLKNLPRFQLANQALQTKSEENKKMRDEDTNSNEDSTICSPKNDDGTKKDSKDKTETHKGNSKKMLFLEEQVKIQEVTLRAWRHRREEVLVEKEAALAKKRELIDHRSNLIERQTTMESARAKQLVLQADLKESLAMSREKLKRLLMLENETEKDERSRDTDTDTDGFLDFSETLREPSEASIEVEDNFKEERTFANIPASSDFAPDTEAKDDFPVLFDSYQNVYEMSLYHDEVRNHRSLLGFLPYLDSSRVGEYLTLMLLETCALDADESSGKEKSLRRQLLQNTCLDVLLLAPSKVCEKQCAAYSDATPQFFDPNISLCPYELSGVCADDLCPYQHTRKPTKILARERLPLPSLSPAFLSIEVQTKNVGTGQSTKTSNEGIDIVTQKGDTDAEYGENERKPRTVNRKSTIANDGDTIGEEEDFILLPPSDSPNDDVNEHRETGVSDDDNNKGEENSGFNPPDFNEKDEKDSGRHEEIDDWDYGTSASFWWSDHSQIYGETTKILTKDTKTTAVSILHLLKDTFGVVIHEYPKRATDGSPTSTEKRLEMTYVGGGNDIVHDIGVLGRLVDTSRLCIHGGLHGVAITSIEHLGEKFLGNGLLQSFSSSLRVQIEMSRIFDQFSPTLSCFEEVFTTQMSFAILSWSVATYRKMEEKYGGSRNLNLVSGCERCLKVMRNPNYAVEFETSDDIPLQHALMNDSFGEGQESNHNCSKSFTVNTAIQKVNGLRSFISWAWRNSIPHREEPDSSELPIEERLNCVWLTVKNFLKGNESEVEEQENGGDFVDTLDRHLHCMKAIIFMGFTMFGCLSEFACGAIVAKKSEANVDADHLSASNLAAWTLLDGAIARVLKDMRETITGFPFLDAILAPLFSCSVASATYLRNYSTAQKRLIDCLSKKHDNSTSNLMVYSELLWSQLVQLRMSLPNESPVTFNPSDDFAWEPSKALTKENQQLIAKLKSLDIRLRHVVLWGDWMLSSSTEKRSSSQTLLQLFSKNQDEPENNCNGMLSTSIEWRDYLEKLYGKSRKGNQVSAGKFPEIYFRNRHYPPPPPLPRLPLFLLHAGKFLTDLNLQGCALQKLPLAFGLYFPNLRNLDLSHNDLRELPESFRKLTQRMKHLEIFCASHNQLESLPSDTLSVASAKQVSLQSPLRILNLSYNQLVSVPSLLGLENLEVLALQHNALVDISVADWSRLALRLPSLRILTREDQCEREKIPSLEE